MSLQHTDKSNFRIPIWPDWSISQIIFATWKSLNELFLIGRPSESGAAEVSPIYILFASRTSEVAVAVFYLLALPLLLRHLAAQSADVLLIEFSPKLLRAAGSAPAEAVDFLSGHGYDCFDCRDLGGTAKTLDELLPIGAGVTPEELVGGLGEAARATVRDVREAEEETALIWTNKGGLPPSPPEEGVPQSWCPSDGTHFVGRCT